MLDAIDNFIIQLLTKRFESNKPKIRKKVLVDFLRQHPQVSEEQWNNLCNNITKEELRVYQIADLSLKEAGVNRVKYIFLGGALSTILLMGCFNGFGSITLSIFSPLIGLLIAALFTLVTIEIPYTKRITAGYKSPIIIFMSEFFPDESYKLILSTMQGFYREVHPLVKVQEVVEEASLSPALSQRERGFEIALFERDKRLAEKETNITAPPPLEEGSSPVALMHL